MKDAASTDMTISLKSRIGALEQLMDVYEKAVIDQSDKLIEEIEERKQAEQRLRKLNRTLTVLSECNSALVHASEEKELVESICKKIIDIGGYNLAWVEYIQEDRRPDDSPEARINKSGGIFERGKLRAIASATNTRSPRPAEDAPPKGKTTGSYNTIAFPLVANSSRLGALCLYARGPEAFDNDEIRLLAELSDDLAYGIQSLRTEAERDRAEGALRQRQRAIESSSNGIIITDAVLPDNPVIYVNPAFEHITGYSASEVMGKNPRFLLGDDRGQLGSKRIRASLREQMETQAVLRNYRKDGSLFWNDLKIAPVRDEAGRVTNFVGVQNDITELKRYEEDLERQANYDTLTGLSNRNLFHDRLAQAISQAKRSGNSVAVAFLDLDHFKVINDSLGHGAGDELLKAVAGRLESSIREGDTAARFGGDEFVLLFPNLPSKETVFNIMRRVSNIVACTPLLPLLKKLLFNVSKPATIAETDLNVTCSIGVSIYPQDGGDVETLLKNADAALYRAKEQGRNNFQFYTNEMNQKVVARMTLEKHLRRAMEKGEMFLHYQPQVDLETGQIIGTEALLRWQNPELGMVPPLKFIPFAEETGLIVPIGEWALRTACAASKAWQDAGLPCRTIAVNISARQFWQHDLFGTVSRALQDSGLDPCCLELEIVESMVIQNVESAIAMLKRLKDLGVRLTMDDFGTGYSSLGYLKRFPFDKLKIDLSFVREITTDPNSAAIVNVIIAMAHHLNLRVVAEGVETEQQLDYLREHGCEAIQGYYFSKPVPARELEQMLREGRKLYFPRLRAV